MNFEEFLKPREQEEKISEAEQETTSEIQESEEVSEAIDLDVQKAVVESLAADKAMQDETIDKLTKSNEDLQREKTDLLSKIENLNQSIAELNQTIAGLNRTVAEQKQKLTEQNAALSKVGDILAKNAEGVESNKISLLDREIELPDRFPGETRDQVLEVLKEARDQAEAEGRNRRAQVLEGVLVANEPIGELAKKRAALEKFFAENQNILSGPVIEELERCGISHKHGEEYLLPSEILKRTY